MSHLFHEPFEAAVHGRRRYAPVVALAVGGDVGRSAAVTFSVTGKGDDPFVNLALSIGPGLALAIDGGQALAVEILAAFAGKSAAKTV